MRIYVDANVYLDYLQERKNREGRDLGELAAELFTRAVGCEFEIVLSDHVLDEMYKHASVESARMLWEFLLPKVIMVWQSGEDKEYAKSLPTHFDDALHITLARRTGAKLIVTRNKTHFRELIEAKCPEEI